MTETMNKIKADLSDILETLAELVKSIEEHRDKDHETQKQLQERVRDLYLIVVGHDGKNGLRSRIKTLETKHEGVDPQDIKDKLDGIEKWKFQTMAILAFVQLFLVPVAIALMLKFIQ